MIAYQINDEQTKEDKKERRREIVRLSHGFGLADDLSDDFGAVFEDV